MKEFFSFASGKKKSRSTGGSPLAWEVPGERQQTKMPHRKFKYQNMVPRKNSLQRSAFRPESFVSRAKKNSSLLDEIRQEPVQSRRSRPLPKKERTFSFSIPLFPALSILSLGALLLISNRERISNLMYRDVVPASTLEDLGGRLNIVSYAGLRAAENLESPMTENLESRIVIREAPPIEVPNIEQDAGLQNSLTDDLMDRPIPLKTVEYFTWENYTVKSGDSVSKIAVERGLSYDAIIASNNLSNAHILKIGQTLRLPNMNGIPYVVKQGDTLTKISKNWNIPLEVIADVNDIQKDLLYPGQTIFLPGARMAVMDLRLALGTLFIHPLQGSGARLSSSFGWRIDPFTETQRLHEALDLAVASGTPVKAASDGRVTLTGNDPGLGKFIILSHNDNYETLYAHLSVVSVKQGDRVEQGVKIGEVGNTGRSTGSHLHFALYKDHKAVNPLDYIAH